MKPITVRLRFISISVLIGLTILSGCSRVKLLYNFSDWFLLNRIDHYFELNSSQRSTLKENLVQLVSWHRKSQLPEIADDLSEFLQRYQDELSREDLDWFLNRHRYFWQTSLMRALPEFSVFLSAVTEKQIVHLEQQMEKRNDFLIKETNITEDERTEDSTQWVLDTLESWYGTMDAKQKIQIKSWIRVDKNWIHLRLENRRKIQKRFSRLLRSGKKADEIEKQLKLWIQHPGIHRSPEFQLQVENRISYWKKFLIQVDSICHPRQREYLQNHINKYINEFRDLNRI